MKFKEKNQPVDCEQSQPPNELQPAGIVAAMTLNLARLGLSVIYDVAVAGCH